MNRKMLPKLRGKYVGLRPIARRFHPEGHELDLIDDNWLVTESTGERVTIQCVRPPDYELTFGVDHIHEFRSASSPAPRSGILVLHSRVFLQGTRAWVEPITHRQGSDLLAPTLDNFATAEGQRPLSVWQILFFALGGAAAYALINGE